MSDCSVLSAGDPAPVTISREHSRTAAAAKFSQYRPPPGSSSAAPNSGGAAGNRSPAVAPVDKIAAEKVLRSFNTWAFKREQPADPHLMLQTVAETIGRAEPVSFVLYWGKGPRRGIAEPESQCLDFLAALAGRVREAYPPGAGVKLIFTDTHARLNGHSHDCIAAYFAEVEGAARQRGFECCWLSQLTCAAETVPASDLDDDVVPEDTLQRLSASARKWYRGNGSVEQGALNYYQMNMVEKRAVELAFPCSIFVTFNGSELRSLFPKGLPIFYMYSIRRGVSSKPWFLASDTAPRDAAFEVSSFEMAMS